MWEGGIKVEAEEKTGGGRERKVRDVGQEDEATRGEGREGGWKKLIW